METLPTYISPIFIAITAVTVIMFFIATKRNITALLVVVGLAIAQAVLGINGYFLKTDATPPRLIALLLPIVVIMVAVFSTKRGRTFVDKLDLKAYTYLHTVRVGVEFVILWLFIGGLMPESMTFEGRNFDIFSGITAPFVAYFGFSKKKLSNKAMLVWNIVCLLLVLQVVITGILSIESVFQQMSFDTPNKAILYFPYVWLPGIIVPIVIFGHIISIRQLRAAIKTESKKY